MIAKIALEGLVYAIDKPYSYLLPAALHKARPGCRVSVPFGAGNRRREGIILTLEEGEGAGLKSVSDLLDPEPILSERMLRMAAFVRERYFCTFYDAIRAMLPAGLWLQTKEVFVLDKLPEDWTDRLDGDSAERNLITLIRDAGGRLRDDALFRQCGSGPCVTEALRQLRSRGWLKAETELHRKNSDKTELILYCT